MLSNEEDDPTSSQHELFVSTTTGDERMEATVLRPHRFPTKPKPQVGVTETRLPFQPSLLACSWLVSTTSSSTPLLGFLCPSITTTAQ
jgi:hypothetical protein